jgi:hypothetical protein
MPPPLDHLGPAEPESDRQDQRFSRRTPLADERQEDRYDHGEDAQRQDVIPRIAVRGCRGQPDTLFETHRYISVSVGPIAVLRAGLRTKGVWGVVVVEVTDPLTPFGRAILP